MMMGTCSGDVLISATCPVSAPKSVRGFVGRLKVSSSGRGPVGRAKAHSLYSLISSPMPKRVIRTCLYILRLVYELEFRSPSASYIVVGAILIFRPPSAPPRATSSVILPSFARSRRQPMLVYCCINSRRWPLGVVGCRSTYIGRYRVVSRWGRFAGFFGA